MAIRKVLVAGASGLVGHAAVRHFASLADCEVVAVSRRIPAPVAVLGFPTRFSLGFMLSQPGAELGPNPRSFGHPGAGGSLGFADPDRKIGFGYVMNQMGSNATLLDPRTTALISAVYASF